MEKLRPADCIDEYSAQKLNEQGIGHNNESIKITDGHVILELNNVIIKIGRKRFMMFAEWFLEEQEISK